MIKKLNKKLTIKISDDDDDEKSVQENHTQVIKEKASVLIENLNLDQLSKINIDEKTLNFNNPNLSRLIEYMEGKNKEFDISYIWLTNLSSVLKLSKCIYFSPKSWESFYETRDFDEEFKVSIR